MFLHNLIAVLLPLMTLTLDTEDSLKPNSNQTITGLKSRVAEPYHIHRDPGPALQLALDLNLDIVYIFFGIHLWI